MLYFENEERTRGPKTETGENFDEKIPSLNYGSIQLS